MSLDVFCKKCGQRSDCDPMTLMFSCNQGCSEPVSRETCQMLADERDARRYRAWKRRENIKRWLPILQCGLLDVTSPQ